MVPAAAQEEEERPTMTEDRTRADKMPELMSARQAAEVLQVTPRMVTAMCSSGKLKAVRVGRLWRVNRDALFDFAGLR